MKKIWARIDRELGADFASPAFDNRDAAITHFNRYNEGVARAIPAERLLIFQATDGWEALCPFLGVAVPDRPCPHANTSEGFRTGTVPDPDAR
jgi:Sulfotransferase domain